jgi:catechol 2,3-dioxygenase-like lactoylglutathione lyase family enzyme
MHQVHFILYVRDQQRSSVFYSAVLQNAPVLDVPGMTQFDLPGGAILGLMPESAIVRLLGDALPDPVLAQGVPRSELYMLVSSAEHYLHRALSEGARLLSVVQPRDWGDTAGYCLDPDGHVLAFADAGNSK